MLDDIMSSGLFAILKQKWFACKPLRYSMILTCLRDLVRQDRLVRHKMANQSGSSMIFLRMDYVFNTIAIIKILPFWEKIV